MSNLIGPSIWSQTAESFLTHIKSLVQRRPSKASKAVPDVAILIGKKEKLTLRIKRNPKQITVAELGLLKQEYGSVDVLELMKARKIPVLDEEGKCIYELKSKRVRKASKKNALSESGPIDGKDHSGDQQLQSGPDSNLPS